MNKGFTLIEIMMSVALTAVVLPALVLSLGFSLKTARQGEKYTMAYSLAQEQMEAVNNIKNSGDATWEWTVDSPYNTAAGEYYQPYLDSGVWKLGTRTTAPLSYDGYTKKVEIKEVNRDASGNISDESWAMPDDLSRWINVYVIWYENGEVEEIKLTSLITRH